MVAEVSGCVHKHKLGDLSEEEAWTLFEKIAFEYKEHESLNLVEIGKEIMRKCGGVPLAISIVTFVTLPNTITKLHNLQILKLDGCHRLEKLPRDIWRLVSLRRLICQGCSSLTHIPPRLSELTSLMHLDFDGCSSLEGMPAGVGQLTSLRTLSSFIIGKESCISGQASDWLNELKGLVDLRNSLSIKFLGRVCAIGERTLTALEPYQNIERLRIKIYSGSWFPSWLMVENLGLSLPKLVDLHIEDCHKCQKLPPLWKLSSLRSLELRNLGGLEGYDVKFMQPSKTPTDERYYFSSLKQLELKGISEKKELTVDSVEGLATMYVFKNLMSLQSLSIKICRNLVSLSTCLTHLTSLETLTIAYCPELDFFNEEEMQFQVPGNLSTLNLWELEKLTLAPTFLSYFEINRHLQLSYLCNNSRMDRRPRCP
ncbi:hypothetical protein T459_07296 [Capsicum annuum]|uniref:Disease resistance R13L4/SHOC-2-like LRR domain-containing protein n=1 Tax=Capsicum annuum TaxID=4072 RepID=A0A2G2ZT83_CAPAN|nr:hypothetical protein T459_07296 [Capsicum annuum]